jgi:hypothetical protein
MDSAQTKGMLQRVMLSQEGIDFVAYLKELSLDNYKSFKADTPEMNEIHKGYALAIDSLIESLESSVKTITPKEVTFG